MKVLHLLCSNQYSGAENVVCQIIGMMKNEDEYEMVYCSPDGQIRQALEERQIAFVPVQKMATCELRRVLTEEKPDIVHAHDMRASFIAALVCGKIPLVSHIHNNNFDSRGLSAKSVAYLLAAAKAKHIFWVSQSSYDGYAFSKLFETKSTVLYNIIDIDALYRKMNSDNQAYDYDIIYVGRLTFQKNPQRLMNVFRLVKEKMQDVKMAVVGTGDLEAETKALAEEYGLVDNVHFLGFQSNPLKMLHDAKVMVMTSRWEGTPMCALEAMALGVPIVSTPTDGLCDLVQDSVSGFLSNEDQILAERVIQLILDSQMRDKLSACAKNKSTEINDKEGYRQKLRTIYERQ